MFNKEKSVKFCDIAIEWLLLATVFLIPLVFAAFYELFSIFVIYKVVLLRVLVSLTVIFYLAKIFLEGKITYRPDKKFFLFAIFLSVFWLFSSFFSLDHIFSFWGLYNRQQGFFTLIFYLLFFLLLILNLKDFFQIRRFIATALFSSFFVCLYGLMQYFQLDPLKWEETARIFSTLGQPNFLGHFLILVIPFSVYALFFQARRFLIRSLLLILLFGQLFCLVFTASRSAFLGLGAEIFLAAFIFLVASGRKKLAFGLTALFMAAFILLGFSSAYFLQKIPPNSSPVYRVMSIFNFSQGSVKARFNNFQAGWDELCRESPGRLIFGYGPDSLSEIFARHYQPSWALDEQINTWPDRVHNVFLDTVLSFGLLGLAVYLWFFYFFISLLWRRLPAMPKDGKFWLAIACLTALGGYFTNNLFSFSDTTHFLYFFLILGWLVSLLYEPADQKEVKINFNYRSYLAVLIAVVIFGGIFIFYFNLRPVLADYYFMKSFKAVRDDCPEALNDNKKAIVLGGGNSLFYQGEYIFTALKCFDRLPSNEDRQRAGENMLWYLNSLPVDNYFYFAKYKVDAEAKLSESFDKSYRDEAEKDFKELAEKYPYLSFIYEDWANFEYNKGDYRAAVEAAQKGIETLPLDRIEKSYHRAEIESQLARFYDFTGASYVGLKDWYKALDYYQRIIEINPQYLGIYRKIADIYQQKGDLDKALWYNEKGYSLDKNDYVWPLAIGQLYKKKGDRIKAEEYAQEALLLHPQDKEIIKFLETLK
jgi:tetratricopeptide (TPR) repeat protein